MVFSIGVFSLIRDYRSFLIGVCESFPIEVSFSPTRFLVHNIDKGEGDPCFEGLHMREGEEICERT